MFVFDCVVIELGVYEEYLLDVGIAGGFGICCFDICCFGDIDWVFFIDVDGDVIIGRLLLIILEGGISIFSSGNGVIKLDNSVIIVDVQSRH